MRKSKTKLSLLFIFIFFSGSASAQEDDYEAALKSYNLQDVDAAYIHVRNALQENSDNLPAKILMAEILIKLKSYNLAEVELISAIEQGADINLLIEPLGSPPRERQGTRSGVPRHRIPSSTCCPKR